MAGAYRAEQSFAACMAIFPILNDEQRVATAWGLVRTAQINIQYTLGSPPSQQWQMKVFTSGIPPKTNVNVILVVTIASWGPEGDNPKYPIQLLRAAPSSP